jgi:hypothetical protein
MAGWDIEIKGLEKLNRLLILGGSTTVTVLSQELYSEANEAFNKSQDLVPVDTGRLKSSGRVEMPVVTGNNVVVQIAYGTEYALPVHENLEAYHASPTQAKYLEQPVLAQINGMGDRIAKAIDKAIGGVV